MTVVQDKIQDSIDRQLQAQPKEVVFCKRCVVSNQRPRITFNDSGICSACQYSNQKRSVIDWQAREEQLQELCKKYRRSDGYYDVVVPGSGGKDSATVAHRLKHQYGMHPLTITWAPFSYTDIGWKNYQSFINAGFANLLAFPNRRLHRKLSRISFEAVGDNFQPFSYGQMAYVFHIALKFDIKLVFFGENAEAEYGGSTKHNYLPSRPIEDFAEMYFKGTTVDDLIEWGKTRNLISRDDYDPSDLIFYKPPAITALKEKEIQMHWFSYYHNWIPQENYYYAAEHTGFQANPDGRSEGTYSKYASLDDKLDGLHYYMAYIKFGIGRATSDAAHEIRDGHITRQEAIALVKRYDGEFPKKYLQETLEYLNLSEEKFWGIVDRYRSPHLWKQENGEWQLRSPIWAEG